MGLVTTDKCQALDQCVSFVYFYKNINLISVVRNMVVGENWARKNLIQTLFTM